MSCVLWLAEHKGRLALGLLIPKAAVDADREEMAEEYPASALALDALDDAAKARLVEAVRRSPIGCLVGTARWFELLMQVASVRGASVDTVAGFAAFAMQSPDSWLPPLRA